MFNDLLIKHKRFQHSSPFLARPGNQKAQRAGFPITQTLGAGSPALAVGDPPRVPLGLWWPESVFHICSTPSLSTRQAQPRPRRSHRSHHRPEHGAQGEPRGAGARGRGGADLLRLPLPAAAGAAAAGSGHRGDRAGLPHGEHQPLPASQRHSVLGWDHCKHRLCSA